MTEPRTFPDTPIYFRDGARGARSFHVKTPNVQ